MTRFRAALLVATIAAGIPTLGLAQPPGGDPGRGGWPEGGRPEGGRPDGGRGPQGGPPPQAQAQPPQGGPGGERGPRGGFERGDGHQFGRSDGGQPGGFGRADGDERRGFPGGPGGPGFDGGRRDGDRRDVRGGPGAGGWYGGDRRGFAGRPGGVDPGRPDGFDRGPRGDDRGPRGVDDRRGPGYGGPGRGDPRDRGRFAGGPGWRNDRRYDWRGFRDQHRETFRVGRYVAPRGWGYGYRRFDVGFRLQPFFFARNYWIDDPYAYRLPPADGPYRWVRYYDDVLLVDLRDGAVVDAIHDFFW